MVHVKTQVTGRIKLGGLWFCQNPPIFCYMVTVYTAIFDDL